MADIKIFDMDALPSVADDTMIPVLDTDSASADNDKMSALQLAQYVETIIGSGIATVGSGGQYATYYDAWTDGHRVTKQVGTSVETQQFTFPEAPVSLVMIGATGVNANFQTFSIQGLSGANVNLLAAGINFAFTTPSNACFYFQGLSKYRFMDCSLQSTGIQYIGNNGGSSSSKVYLENTDVRILGNANGFYNLNTLSIKGGTITNTGGASTNFASSISTISINNAFISGAIVAGVNNYLSASSAIYLQNILNITNNATPLTNAMAITAPLVNVINYFDNAFTSFPTNFVSQTNGNLTLSNTKIVGTVTLGQNAFIQIDNGSVIDSFVDNAGVSGGTLWATNTQWIASSGTFTFLNTGAGAKDYNFIGCSFAANTVVANNNTRLTACKVVVGNFTINNNISGVAVDNIKVAGAIALNGNYCSINNFSCTSATIGSNAIGSSLTNTDGVLSGGITVSSGSDMCTVFNTKASVALVDNGTDTQKATNFPTPVDFNDSSTLRTVKGMALAKGVGNYWLCGPGQDYENLSALLAYLDSLSPALTQYNIRVVTPCIENANYTITNTSLQSLNIEVTDPNLAWQWGNYQVLNFSNLTSLPYLTLGKMYVTYNYASAKHAIVAPVSGDISSFIFNAWIYNQSPNGYDTSFFEGNYGTSVYSGDYATITVAESSQGGIYKVLWTVGPLRIYGEADTVENVFGAASTGANSVFSALTIGGSFADGAGYASPIIDCGNLVVANLYVSVIAGVTIKSSYAGIANVWCDLGNGYILFDCANRLKVGTGFTNTGRAKLHTSGIYTFDGVAWEGFDLEPGFTQCDLYVTDNMFSGTNEGMVGGSYYTATAVDVLVSGTSESNLYLDTTSTYTFFKNGQELIVESYLSSTVAGGTNNTYRFYVNDIVTTPVFTFTESTNVDLQFTFKLYRQGNSNLRLTAEVIKNGATPSISHYDISVDPLTNIGIRFSAQGGNAGNQSNQHLRTTTHSGLA